MNTVSSSSLNYVVAQQQIREYQRNFNSAGKNYIGNKSSDRTSKLNYKKEELTAIALAAANIWEDSTFFRAWT